MRLRQPPKDHAFVSVEPFINIPPTTTTTLPPPTTAAPQRVVKKAVSRSSSKPRSQCRPRSLDQIAADESGGNYTAQNPTSTASGKYQVLNSTWDGYAGYPSAASAPPAVQEQHARELYAKKGAQPWDASC